MSDICLVNMPFDSGNLPSLGLGLLQAKANAEGLSTQTIYASLIFTNRIGPDKMKILLSYSGMNMLSTEAVFQPFAGYSDFASNDQIMEYLKGAEGYPEGSEKVFMDIVAMCQEQAEQFLDEVCERILETNPKIVGCTHFLLQLNASLAILKRIREKRPDIITIIGGAGCSAYSGQAIVDYMPQVDFVFCGESDDVFAPACRLMMAGDQEAIKKEFPCVLQKGGTYGVSHQYKDLKNSIFPDFDDFFSELKRQGLEQRIKPLLPIEASRGCWWGKCNFCGLNEKDGAHYRFKPSERVAKELEYLSNRYGTKHFFFSDCIMADVHLRQLKDLLAGKNYLMHTEVKTSMTFEELSGIREAGFYWVVPGIESIQDDVLRHINKGNRAIKNIEFLKWCKIVGIDPLWNMMYGFPKEEIEWYNEIIDIVPCLTHFKWPITDCFRYQRKSNFTIEKEKYGVNPVPHSMYSYFLGKDEEFHEDYAEYFEVSDVSFEYEARLKRANRIWMAEYMRGATLTFEDTEEEMLIKDTRGCAVKNSYTFTGLMKLICKWCECVITKESLLEKARCFDEVEFEQAIDLLKSKRLLLQIGDELLFLALPVGFEKADTKESFMLWDME